MEIFLNSVASVAIILLLTMVGYICGAMHWMGAETKAFISKFLMTIAVPVMSVYCLQTNLSQELLAQSGSMLLVVFVCCVMNFVLSFLVGKLLRIPHRRLGVFMMMCALSNSVFIGFAMCSELFGEAATPYVMIYYCISTTFTQVVGMALIRWSGTNDSGFSLQSFTRLLKMPTIWGVAIGFALLLADIRLPSLVLTFSKYMNNLVTPLALLLTGYIIYGIDLKNLKIDVSMIVMLLFRFLFAPALCFALCSFFGISGLARSVFIVESAMPVVTQTVVASAEYGADEQFAAQGAAISTFACFFVTPVLMMIL